MQKIEVPKDELLLYLGYGGQKINNLLEDKIQKMIELCQKTAVFKSVYHVFDLDGRTVKDTSLSLKGDSIIKHLKGCDKIVLLAATLGFNLEREIETMFVKDKTSAVILDACGSAAIESCLNKEFVFDNATERFSCGYGDFPLETNKTICDVLNTQRLIGLSPTPENMLTPKKSVTAVIGLGSKNKIQPLCDHKCNICKHEKCLYSK